jgi:hypothetical protein
LNKSYRWGIIEVGGSDGRFFAVPLVHQLEERIRMLRIEREVPQLIDEKRIGSREPLEELGGTSVGEADWNLVSGFVRRRDVG